MDKAYRVIIQVEGLGKNREVGEEIPRPMELASFETLEEARIFRNELMQHYSVKATGESAVLEQMTTMSDYLAGD